MLNPAPESDDPPRGDEAPGWNAVTAFIPWDQTLPIGTRLRDYEIRSVIGESPFAIVYLAWDDSLHRRVALKEYLPRSLAARARDSTAIEPNAGAAADGFATGLKAFIAEARMLARFDHAALLKVYRFWEENGTGYMVMPHCDGPSLESALTNAGRPQDEAEVRAWLRPVLDAVSVLHAAGCYHQHIGPDNILLTPNGPVLLDFAAARRVVDGLAGGPASVVKPGYAPIEQYTEAAPLALGPWTDLYALAAVACRAVSGRPPPPAPERVDRDPLMPLARLGAVGCGNAFLQAIDATLAVQPEHRPRNDTEFRELMGGIDAPLPALPIASQRDLMAEPFASGADSAPEVTVPMPMQPHPPPPEAAIEAEEPMAQPFLAVPAALPARLPFAREEFGLSRKAMIGIAAGVGILGAVAASVLFFYAGRPLDASGSGAAEAASAVAGPASTPGANRPAARPPAVVPAVAPVAEPSPVADAPPVVLPAPVGASAVTPTSPAAASAVPALDGEAARRIPVERAAPGDADRRVRCSDLLQEATLRRLTAAEAAFFRKECR